LATQPRLLSGRRRHAHSFDRIELHFGGRRLRHAQLGQIVVSGPSNNLLVITALAAQKASWPTGVYPVSLSANDGAYTRDLFASSTLAIGAPQIASVTLTVAPDNMSRSVVARVPAALAAALQALQPAALASALAGLDASDLSLLVQALFAALPIQVGSSAPVAAGQPFINSSGFVVIAP
jgi:hypothetical protein